MSLPLAMMSVLPVIVRELRSQARQPLPYWLRLVGGLSVAAAMGAALWHMRTVRVLADAGSKFPGHSS